jgi:hypothetical protein
MTKRIEYSIWLEENKEDINRLMKDIFKSISHLQMPQVFNLDFYYKEELQDDLLKYIYNNSSSSIRKG